MKDAQKTRELFKPINVKVLYVAESPPTGGTFFYFENSNLYFAILDAFEGYFENISFKETTNLGDIDSKIFNSELFNLKQKLLNAFFHLSF